MCGLGRLGLIHTVCSTTATLGNQHNYEHSDDDDDDDDDGGGNDDVVEENDDVGRGRWLLNIYK